MKRDGSDEERRARAMVMVKEAFLLLAGALACLPGPRASKYAEIAAARDAVETVLLAWMQEVCGAAKVQR